MTGEITPEQARQYVERWRLANAREIEELRQMTAEEKLRITAALMESALALGWSDRVPEEDAAVRERWRKIRAYYAGQ
jgi:hypothetical protein